MGQITAKVQSTSVYLPYLGWVFFSHAASPYKNCRKNMFWLSLFLVLLMKFICNVFQGRLPFSINWMNSIDIDGVLLFIQTDTLGLYICKGWTQWPWGSFLTLMILWCYTVLFSICTWLTSTIWFPELKDNSQDSWKHSASPFFNLLCVSCIFFQQIQQWTFKSILF